MPKEKKLHDLFIDELKDAYDAEKQIIKALPKIIKAAADADLREGLSSHLEETKGQVERLEEIFGLLDEKVQGKKCDGMKGILEEGGKALEELEKGATRDAAIIAGCQRVEHYEISAYGTMVAWARTMGHTDAVKLLEETLEEEKAADEKLDEVAETVNNEANSGEEDEEEPVMAGGGGRAKSRKK